MSDRPIVFGAAYSVYVRAVRLVLHEKGVAYDHVDVDVFAPSGPPAEHLARHPFGRIPAFEHDGFPALRKQRDRALCRCGVRRAAVATGRTARAGADEPGAERARRLLLPHAGLGHLRRTCACAGDVAARRTRRASPPRCRAPTPACARWRRSAATVRWLAGPALTLADLHAAPMFVYFRMAPEGAAAIARHPRIAAWLDAMMARPSLAATCSPLE